MNSRNPVQATVIACAVLALAGLALSAILGHPRAGLALAAGILIGSGNGFLAERALSLGGAFRATSLLRLALLSAAGLGAGLLIGLDVAWWSLVGLAAAQVVLALVAARAVVRR